MVVSSSCGNSSEGVTGSSYHPRDMMISSMRTDVATLNTGEFAALARAISSSVRALGLVAPGFRCPTRVLGVDRTMRRFTVDSAAGTVAGIVAVNVKGRPLAAVVADMIEGVVMLNQLSAVEAARVRSVLWQSLERTTSTAHVA